MEPIIQMEPIATLAQAFSAQYGFLDHPHDLMAIAS
jgi:hypothetical protein